MAKKLLKLTRLTLFSGETFIFENDKYSMVEMDGYYKFLKNDFSSEFKFNKNSIGAIEECAKIAKE